MDLHMPNGRFGQHRRRQFAAAEHHGSGEIFVRQLSKGSTERLNARFEGFGHLLGRDHYAELGVTSVYGVDLVNPGYLDTRPSKTSPIPT